MQRTGDDELDLTRREVVRAVVGVARGAVLDRDIGHRRRSARGPAGWRGRRLRRCGRSRRVDERERQHTEVDEVLRVDAGEALGDHGAQAEVARRDRGVLAARALAVVVAADDDVAAASRAARARGRGRCRRSARRRTG